MELTQPSMYCPKCGELIPANTDFITKDSEGKTVYGSKMSRLSCEGCAIAACPPKPKKRGLKRGEVAAEQMRFDGPTVYID